MQLSTMTNTGTTWEVRNGGLLHPVGGCEGNGLALARGVETKKSRIRKTNLECALESTVSLFGVSLSASHIGRAGRLVAAGREAQRRRAMGADVDNTGLKRTADGIMLKVKEIIAFGANELRWVKSFVM